MAIPTRRRGARGYLDSALGVFVHIWSFTYYFRTEEAAQFSVSVQILRVNRKKISESQELSALRSGLGLVNFC